MVMLVTNDYGIEQHDWHLNDVVRRWCGTTDVMRVKKKQWVDCVLAVMEEGCLALKETALGVLQWMAHGVTMIWATTQ
jgi:hypothetical protein